MHPIKFTADGSLDIVPSPSSSASDFNFFEGKWNIRNKKLKTRLNHCTEWEYFDATGEMEIILNATGNTDNFITDAGGQVFEGRTLRLFNPQTKLWSIYWADSSRCVLDPPVVGSFDNHTGLFYATDTCEGIPVIIKFMWDKTDPQRPVWSQAFSADAGITWEWNWYMYFSRQA